jgi:hypothetical protein
MTATFRNVKTCLGLKADADDVAALETVLMALRQRDRYATRADALRFALQAGAREVRGGTR